jgi:hypothetical protein
MGAGKSRDGESQEQSQQQQANDFYAQQCQQYQSFAPQTPDLMQQRMQYHSMAGSPPPQSGGFSPMPTHQPMMSHLVGHHQSPNFMHQQLTYGPKLGPMPIPTQMGYQANLPLKPFPGYPNGISSVPKFNQQQQQQSLPQTPQPQQSQQFY